MTRNHLLPLSLNVTSLEKPSRALHVMPGDALMCSHGILHLLLDIPDSEQEAPLIHHKSCSTQLNVWDIVGAQEILVV